MNDSFAMRPEDYLTSPMTDEEYLQLRSYETFTKLLPTVFFIAGLITVGLPGNLLVFVVYFRHFRPNATRVFVLAMSACDFLIVSLCLPLQIVYMRELFSAGDPQACAALYVVQQFAILMSAWLLVCVALDRYRRVCQPMKQQLSHVHACWLLLLPVAVASLVNIPSIPLYGHRNMPTERNGTSGRVCAIRDEFADTTYATVHNISMMGSLLVGVIALVIAYCCVLYKVQMLKRRRTEMMFSFIYKSGKDKPNTHVHCSVSRTRPEDRVMSTATECNSSEVQGLKTNCNLRVQRPQVEKLGQTCNENCSLSGENDIALTESTGGANSGLTKDLSCLGGSELPKTSINKERKPSQPADGESYSKSSVDSCPSKDQDLTSSLVAVGVGGEGDYSKHNAKESRDGTGVVAPPVRQCLSSDRRLYSKTTTTMLVLTLTFVITFVPYFIITLLPMNPLSLLQNPLHLNLFWIGHLFLNVNSVVNPFIYSFVNPKFRRQCRRLFENICKT